LYWLRIDVLPGHYRHLGWKQVLEMGETAVAVAATNLIGPTFAGIIYVFVTISVMGTVNGVILGSSDCRILWH